MGKRGFKAKPAELHAIAGTLRADRHGGRAKPRPGRPTCPAWLEPAAKSEWRRIVPELSRLGLLTRVDRACLAGYCQAWAEFKAATQTITAEGRVCKNEISGVVKTHPAVLAQRSAWAAILQFSSRFGLDPSGRVKVGDNAKEAAGEGKGRFFAG